MDTKIKFKKLLRLNRLIPLEKLDQERIEKLRTLDLLEEYRKNVKIFPKDWYIRITPENRPYIKKWIIQDRKAEGWLFSMKASYGIINGELYANGSRPSTGTEISTEDFISEIYSKF